MKEVRQYVDTFANVFLDPFVDYLTSSQEQDDLILALMIRYKNRCEWFRAQQLLDIAERTTRDIERALKLDFYEYLFDHGVEFTIDPNSPSGGGEADVLSARFSGGGRLVLEAKVYDGKHRVDSEIKAGVNQAASYARQWLEPAAFLLVYNIAVNTLLSFTGAQQQGNYWATTRSGRSVFVVTMDLAAELPASHASQLKRVNIDLGN